MPLARLVLASVAMLVAAACATTPATIPAPTEPAGSEPASFVEAEPTLAPDPPKEPDDSRFDARLDEAEQLVTDQKYGEAQPILDEVLAELPSQARALTLQAQAQLERGMYDEAQASAQACVNADPNQSYCWITIATIAQHNDELERALEAYEHYIALEPEGKYARSVNRQIERLRAKLSP